ncbi:AAA family ATPase [Methylorubrum rhodesianum]|uniref:AAA family ATPase n=1 Tax=Methylorubrum rhodesianum TaxID=29427 RepID=A0ABU9ZFK1_9HYPH
MSDTVVVQDRLLFRSLSLENVRAFGSGQTLSLVDGKDRPSPWTLILGENGVGKTTVMQALARMRPIPAFSRDASPGDAGEDAGAPSWSEPELSRHENEEIYRFVRTGQGSVTTRIGASLQAASGHVFDIGVVCESKSDKLVSVDFKQAEHGLLAEGPLVIGYGAARHVGHGNSTVVAERDPTDPLFSEAIDLFDAEEILGIMHYAALSGGRKRDRTRLNTLKLAVADLIPDMAASDIEVRGPRVPGRPESEAGVHVRTPSGIIPLAGLSHGYQTVFAWTVDLAWRLFGAFPQSQNPLRERAVVLIDEIDLHLHPRWQRSLRRHLTSHFPGVQFVATTHSPITAQETLSAGGNVAVVRWEGDHAVILNNPLPPREWRFDQVLTSELFGFDSSRGPEAEALMNERLALLRKEKLTPRERRRLGELDAFTETLPTARTPDEQEFEDLMRRIAQHEKAGAAAR